MPSSAPPFSDALEPILDEIRRRSGGRTGPLVVALDGRSGAGKSTAAATLAARLAASVIEGDDFYSGDLEWAAHAPPERAARVIDWRRLRAEALEPLRAGRSATWHPFDFAAGAGLAVRPITRGPAPIVVLDGVYSARPELSDLVDLAVLLELADDVRRRRLVAREGSEVMARWHATWDAAEDHYFTRVRPPASFDLVLER